MEEHPRKESSSPVKLSPNTRIALAAPNGSRPIASLVEGVKRISAIDDQFQSHQALWHNRTTNHADWDKLPERQRIASQKQLNYPR
jgi:hypothetical protein